MNHPQLARAFSYFEQAFVTVMIPTARPIQLDVGRFPTPVGLEDNESITNWSYSRSLLYSWAEPSLHTGMRLSCQAHRDARRLALVGQRLEQRLRRRQRAAHVRRRRLLEAGARSRGRAGLPGRAGASADAARRRLVLSRRGRRHTSCTSRRSTPRSRSRSIMATTARAAVSTGGASPATRATRRGRGWRRRFAASTCPIPAASSPATGSSSPRRRRRWSCSIGPSERAWWRASSTATISRTRSSLPPRRRRRAAARTP